MTLAFHKPYGVLCQFTADQPGQLTLAEFDCPGGVYPLGRLDLESEGLLLLSDEPCLNHLLLDPAHGHWRGYLVQVEGVPDQTALDRFARGGLSIQGHRTRPCKVRVLDPAPEVPPRDPPIRVRRAIPTTWLHIELTEGKNRQVRRMTAAIGHPTLRLIRSSMSDLELGDLPPGHWRPLTPDERGSLPSARRRR